MSRHTLARPLARAAAPLAALAAIALVATPAGAHVSGTPSETAAGSATVLTLSVPHGCEGSPTTRVEVEVPESVLSVTPTRNPFYDVEANIRGLDEPVTDAHGNEVTERTASIVYTAHDPLPDGQRDTFELSFQIPEDLAGDTLAFPTLQTCEQGRTAWVEVPTEAQDAEELEHPAPAFEVTAAAGEDHAESAASAEATSAATQDASTGDSDVLGWTALVLGALGLVAGGTALARSRKPA